MENIWTLGGRKLKPGKLPGFVSARSSGDLPRSSSTLRVYDCLLLNGFLVSMKVFLDFKKKQKSKQTRKKPSNTMLDFLAFKLWSKSNLVNNISPWPGGSYIHMSNCFRKSADTDETGVKPSGLT